MSCDFEKLEALAAGELAGARAQEIEQHVAGCAACRDELGWLRAEAELMQRRRAAQPPLRPELWQRITQRLGERVAQPQRPSRWQRWVPSSMVAAAAAALLLVLTHHVHRTPDVAPDHEQGLAARTTARQRLSPAGVLDGAEREYRDALAQLRSEYQQERGRLPAAVAARYDQLFGAPACSVRLHEGSSDVNGRLLELDGYATCLSSLGRVVAELQVQP
jgi:hypothetical protein